MFINFHLPQNVTDIKIEAIYELITKRQREDSFIDYKRRVPSDLSKVICSFLNNQGGHIVFGVIEEDDIPVEIVGVEKEEFSKLSNQFSKLDPSIDLLRYLKEIELENGKFVGILYLARQKGIWFESSGKFYVRKGASSEPIHGEGNREDWKKNHPENLNTEKETVLSGIQKDEVIQWLRYTYPNYQIDQNGSINNIDYDYVIADIKHDNTANDLIGVKLYYFDSISDFRLNYS